MTAKTTNEPGVSMPLAYNATQAAAEIGISKRLLWEWTSCGKVPHKRIGKRIVYPRAALESWLNESEAAK